jgi:hypothetical protein
VTSELTAGASVPPVNALVHDRDTPDTLRLSASLDLDREAEPLVLVIPPTHGRFYAVWLRDAADRVFASVGARTFGSAPQALGLLGPGRHDLPLPPGLVPVAVPTRLGRVSVCLEAIDEPGAEACSGFALLPLSRWPAARSAVIEPPRSALAHARPEADPVADVLCTWVYSDADGRSLDGRHRYRLRFAPDATPPVHGFWSLTTSPGDTHAVGDRRGLELDADGSLPIHIQHQPPARGCEANWLPAPRDAFSVVLRLYWPRDEALERRWSPPPLLLLAE